MLGKLLKYEFKATGRLMLPIYGAMLVMGLLNGMFVRGSIINEYSAISTTGLMIYGMIIFAAFIVTFYIMVQRFYKNLLGDEGYLMFTLPVRTEFHIISKLLTSAFWMCATIAVTLLSLFFLAVTNLSDFGALFRDIMHWIPRIDAADWAHFLKFVFTYGSLFITSILSWTLLIYASISIGQLVPKYKIFAAFGGFIALSTVQNNVNSFVTNLVEKSFQTVSTMDAPWVQAGNTSITMSRLNFDSLAVTSIIMSIVFAVLYFLITDYILTKHLNLD